MASKDNLLAIKAFFRKFPERSGSSFYLASESYGGHYVPQWTLQVLNDADARRNFKGYLLGWFVLSLLAAVCPSSLRLVDSRVLQFFSFFDLFAN
jgi:hypothetical protein